MPEIPIRYKSYVLLAVVNEETCQTTGCGAAGIGEKDASIKIWCRLKTLGSRKPLTLLRNQAPCAICFSVSWFYVFPLIRSFRRKRNDDIIFSCVCTERRRSPLRPCAHVLRIAKCLTTGRSSTIRRTQSFQLHWIPPTGIVDAFENSFVFRGFPENVLSHVRLISLIDVGSSLI